MGAAASIQRVYREAVKWFLIYIDKETYFADFQILDADCDGAITFGEVQKWLVSNINRNPESCWAIFLTSGTVLKTAHKAACGHLSVGSTPHSRDSVDISEFRSFLIHLYAMSILWRHFASVSRWKSMNQPDELSSKKLNVQEFAVGVRGFCSLHSMEELSDADIERDFLEIDGNLDGYIGFVEVRNYDYNS